MEKLLNMEEIPMQYNRHYIITDTRGRVTDGWSDGPHPNRDTTNTICINEEGGYQFCLFPGGEENPALSEEDGIPLYKWDGEWIIPRSRDEIAADRAVIPPPPPSAQEQQRADVDYPSIMPGIGLPGEENADNE